MSWHHFSSPYIVPKHEFRISWSVSRMKSCISSKMQIRWTYECHVDEHGKAWVTIRCVCTVLYQNKALVFIPELGISTEVTPSKILHIDVLFMLYPYTIVRSTVMGHILLVDNYLILPLKSTRELSNCRPLEFVLGWYLHLFDYKVVVLSLLILFVDIRKHTSLNFNKATLHLFKLICIIRCMI